MQYTDEDYIHVPPGLDLDTISASELNELFEDATPITRFHSSPDKSFIHDTSEVNFSGALSFRLDKDCLIEVNNAFLRSPIVVRNQVANLISFQFVSSVKRSEFVGERKNTHTLGPAVIVSVFPGAEVTYRMPRTNESLRHVMVATTLSNVMQRMDEDPRDYPDWLQGILEGTETGSRQQVFFMEEVHRNLTWSCFHPPVAKSLQGHWMTAKGRELLCVGLQILKNNQQVSHLQTVDQTTPHRERIHRAAAILNREYANPPNLPVLARHLGISETQLKSGFKSLYGVTVMKYYTTRRVEAAKLLLDENHHSIAEVADIVGYEDHSAFSRAFRRLSGKSPREWRKSNNHVG